MTKGSETSSAWRLIAAAVTAGVWTLVMVCGYCHVSGKEDHFLAFVLLGIGAATTVSFAAEMLHSIYPKWVWEVVSKTSLVAAAAWTFAVTAAQYAATGALPSL